MPAVVRRIETDVCIVGAGYAGLTAARRLRAAGRAVVVAEARSRVGGRVWTATSAGGAPLDLGGTFIGPHQDRIHALAAEMGVAPYRTYAVGDAILATGGKIRRYPSTKTPRISPVALLSAGQAIARLDAMARKVPLDAPWDAPRAAAWDAVTAQGWLSRASVPTRTARDLLEATLRALFCCDLSEVSLLNVLFLINSGGGLVRFMSIEGGYQQDMIEGGAQGIADAMAADLGDDLVLESPIHAVRQDRERVEVTGPTLAVDARHVVMAIPPALASRVLYDPPLPGEHALLLHQLPAGTEIKIVAVYDEAFWRADGLAGASVAMDDDVEITLDASPASGTPGVLACFTSGPKARRFWLLPPDERREVVLRMLTARFGPKARSPIEVVEQNWADEEWTRGCSMAHFGTGVLTQFGRLLRQPEGRIHWAGTETATVSHGAIDGAVRSGERVAEEILALQ
jgi:monoamine oxidase